MRYLTPREIVEALDKYIIGQDKAKKAVAIALRNRYRRSMLSKEMQEEITPKNIIMVGPTGVGKTEIARRLSKLMDAPFVKVEATKFTEVGYVGRDVESMVRDLVEASIRMVKASRYESVKKRAAAAAEQRLVELLLPQHKKDSPQNPLNLLFGGPQQHEETESEEEKTQKLSRREQTIELLKGKKLENSVVEVEVQENSTLGMEIAGLGSDINIGDMFSGLLPKKTKKRKMSVAEARSILEQEEAEKLIDMDEVTSTAIERAEQHGIIFLDEIDKIASREGGYGPDVSREGVQRDILPIVEGSTVVTKYGPVKTDHILFIAAGAFHVSKPSDLIPELQGRFPLRVELENLTKGDLKRILIEPNSSLVKQYKALLYTEGLEINFTDEAIEYIAETACEVNEKTENIGARRLHTIMEKVLEDLMFDSTAMNGQSLEIGKSYVEQRLIKIVRDDDLSRYIL
jgi:ATP-dependent HslUV protease ATP-binding subunit HslU